MGTTLESVAAELYAAPLAEFTDRRTALARVLRADDRGLADAVGRLPKPAQSAWAVNRFARERPDDLDDLLDLGAQLREAQREVAADRVKALTANTQALVRRTLDGVAAVAADGGAPLSAALLGQVEQTLRAAMADEDAAGAVRAGVLAKPLAPAGFGPVDLDGAVAVIPAARPARERRLTVVRPAAKRDQDDRGAAAKREAEQAVARLERAEAELAGLEKARAAAEGDHEEAVRRRDDLRAEVLAAEHAEQAAAKRVRDARKEEERAARQAERAKKAVDAIR